MQPVGQMSRSRLGMAEIPAVTEIIFTSPNPVPDSTFQWQFNEAGAHVSRGLEAEIQLEATVFRLAIGGQNLGLRHQQGQAGTGEEMLPEDHPPQCFVFLDLGADGEA